MWRVITALPRFIWWLICLPFRRPRGEEVVTSMPYTPPRPAPGSLGGGTIEVYWTDDPRPGSPPGRYYVAREKYHVTNHEIGTTADEAITKLIAAKSEFGHSANRAHWGVKRLN